MSASQTHNICNLRMTQEQSFASLAAVVRLASPAVGVNVSLSCALGCPTEGDMAAASLWHWCSVLRTWECAASRCAIPRAWRILRR